MMGRMATAAALLAATACGLYGEPVRSAAPAGAGLEAPPPAGAGPENSAPEISEPPEPDAARDEDTEP
jgi:hypothetical protein